MKKKIETEVKKQNVMTKEQYWQWMTILHKMLLAEKTADVAMKTYLIMEKEQKILQLQTHIYKSGVLKNAQEMHELSKKDYNALLDEFEIVHGLAMRGKVIDEVTLELKDPPVDN